MDPPQNLWLAQDRPLGNKSAKSIDIDILHTDRKNKQTNMDDYSSAKIKIKKKIKNYI